MITKFTSSSEGKIIYYFSWLNRLVSCCLIMSRMYIRKTSREQDKIKDRHDLRSKHNLQKSKHKKHIQNWGSGEEGEGDLSSSVGVLGGGAP